MPDAFTELARKTISVYITTGKEISPPSPLPEGMESRAGVFVSLHKFGRLRGCIGTFAPMSDSIAQEIINMAIASSTEDPRFPPVTKAELDDIDINVDVLTEPETINDISELDPKVYGVIVSLGMRKGLLLPDLEGVDTVAEQLRIARAKAGIHEGEKVTIKRFKVIRHK
ncbi:MAG: AmmeMemoRadiSam system protein A [Caldisericia bacterium]